LRVLPVPTLLLGMLRITTPGLRLPRLRPLRLLRLTLLRITLRWGLPALRRIPVGHDPPLLAGAETLDLITEKLYVVGYSRPWRLADYDR